MFVKLQKRAITKSEGKDKPSSDQPILHDENVKGKPDINSSLWTEGGSAVIGGEKRIDRRTVLKLYGVAGLTLLSFCATGSDVFAGNNKDRKEAIYTPIPVHWNYYNKTYIIDRSRTTVVDRALAFNFKSKIKGVKSALDFS